jgi:hypothetical protein
MVCITHRITGFSDFVHRPDSKLLEENQDVQWMRLALSKWPNRVGVFLHLRTETDPVSETSWFSCNYLESGQWTKSENPVIRELYGTHQVLSYAEDISLIGGNINAIQKNTRVLLDDSNEVELKSEPKGNFVTLISCDRNESQNLKY